MDEPIKFYKLSGSGNDFICIDNRDKRFDDILHTPDRAGHFAHTLCHRGIGIGADGLVFASEPDVPGAADLAATFLEIDGTQTALCGNGTACFVHWATESQVVPDGEVRILTSAGVVLGRNVDNGYVRVCIPLPEHMETNLQLDVCGHRLGCDFIVTGVEHVVTYVDNVDQVDVHCLGPAIRQHPRFPQPRGVNANFAQVTAEGEIALRTYEYGVEGETLACGTGSAAAAILAAKRFGWSADYTSGEKPVRIHTRGGDVLRVYLTAEDNGRITDLCLETLVRCCYVGEVCHDLAELATRSPAT